ncbi:MAG: type II toxin-antitoxin system Phd/YefM family antitoxin [Magnetococcales bacterium]|nr:type II toxin-antitoxin system Phd/YefM family antitoxin [Magnetococcales bacterium]
MTIPDPLPEIPAGEFKAHCLKLMDQVATSRTALVVTKRGRPMVRIAPVDQAASSDCFGYMQGTGAIKGDALAPLDVPWEAHD